MYLYKIQNVLNWKINELNLNDPQFWVWSSLHQQMFSIKRHWPNADYIFVYDG